MRLSGWRCHTTTPIPAHFATVIATAETRVITFTIASLAYLPHARVLARSYAQHHPDDKLWVLLIDDVHRAVVEREEPFNVLRLGDLPLERTELHRMAMLFESKLIATIKPWVFAHFLSEGAAVALYIDSDFVIYDSLEGIADSDDGVILVPHVLTPVPRDGMDPDETTLLGSGMYNAGMFGVGRQHGGFLEFLMERLQRECIFDASKMRFNEQRWLDFVPALFPNRIVRDPGIDVAYWNLHERPLSRRDERWFVADAHLRAFHFSSFDPRGEGAGGRYEWTGNPRIQVASNPLFGQLCSEYRRMLYAEGFADSHDRPFAFEMLPDRTPVYHSLRALFRDAVMRADSGHAAYPPDPFDESSRIEFDAWVAQQYARAGKSVPRRLFGGLSSLSNVSEPAGGGSVGSRLRGWVQTRHTRDSVPEPADRRSVWAVDLLDRMILDDAGMRRSTAIEVLPEHAGFVCHGPRIPLSVGSYSVTLEFDGQPVGAGVSELDQALVFEGFVQGYAVGSMAATFADLSTGTLTLDVHIPRHFVREAALFGLELRVLTRGRVRATIAAIVLESFDAVHHAAGSGSTHYDWLPVMAGGEAGQRAGVEVVTTPATTGVVVAGPNWRMTPGSYRASVQLRLEDGSVAGEEVASGTPLALVEVIANDKVLNVKTLTAVEIRRGTVELTFVVDEFDSGPNVVIGVRVCSLTPSGFVVSLVQVDRIAESSKESVSVA